MRSSIPVKEYTGVHKASIELMLKSIGKSMVHQVAEVYDTGETLEVLVRKHSAEEM